MLRKLLFAGFVAAMLPLNSFAADMSLIGTWTSSEDGAGAFSYKDNGQFVWTDGSAIATGVWMFDPDTKTASMILNPMNGVDDQATVSFSDDGAKVEMSFHRVQGKVQDPAWAATYTRKE